uniref:Uncharacterized protein n=1 Tax=Candidatus Kentrum sp. LFY TaxID=2126342 RepID=A0A450V1G1_9GAMM|nr:MAG: hypothetical protein BECKLFY1418B_GA0070995_11246 [Candidatus Kentron sp. LFY]
MLISRSPFIIGGDQGHWTITCPLYSLFTNLQFARYPAESAASRTASSIRMLAMREPPGTALPASAGFYPRDRLCSPSFRETVSEVQVQVQVQNPRSGSMYDHSPTGPLPPTTLVMPVEGVQKRLRFCVAVSKKAELDRRHRQLQTRAQATLKAFL